MNKLPGIALSLAAAVSSITASAQETSATNNTQNKSADFNFQIQAGAEYDSTLTVVELDQTSDKGDWAALLNARVGVELKPTDRITMKGSYNFASRNYREYSNFDQDLHIASLDAGIDLAGITWGVSHHFAHAKLASNSLLDLTKTSLYAGKLFTNGVYLRGAFTESDKRFDTNSERNTDGNEVAGEVYYFFNGARTFWSVGVSQETENARSAAFDNDALKLRARLSHTGELAGHKSQVQVGWRYENRDYSKEESLPASADEGTPADNGDDVWPLGNNAQYMNANTRHDRSQVVEASWALNLLEPLTLETKIEHGNYSSNFDAADYKESGVSVLMSLEF